MAKKLQRARWSFKCGPTSDAVASSSVDVEDHLGKSWVTATEWANGEGFDLTIDREKQAAQRLEISWEDWAAVRAAVRAMKEKSREMMEAWIAERQAAELAAADAAVVFSPSVSQSPHSSAKMPDRRRYGH